MRLICGDCLEEMDKLIKEGVKVDLTVTSPPYDNLRTYNGNNDLWNENVWKGIIERLYKITVDGGVVVWVVGDATVKGSETGTSFKQALYFKKCGFNLHDTMIYQKNNFAYPPVNRYFPMFENMFVLSKGKPKTFNPIKVPTKYKDKEIGMKKSTTRLKNGKTVANKYLSYKPTRIKENIWLYNGGYGKSTLDKIAFEHPATFPEKLANDHIISWSNEGDTVFDPMMGSGTTGKMAMLNNRDFIGIEMDEKYFEIAKKRIEDTLVEKGEICE